jgi:hypothetical protein
MQATLPPHLRGSTAISAAERITAAKALNNAARRNGKLPSKLTNLYTSVNNKAFNASIYNSGFMSRRKNRRSRRSRKTRRN